MSSASLPETPAEQFVLSLPVQSLVEVTKQARAGGKVLQGLRAQGRLTKGIRD